MPEQLTSCPFDSKEVVVHGSRIHYIEAGNQEPPVLLLHDIPTNSYLWRNVIPHVATVARTVAIDLVGFGKSHFLPEDEPENIGQQIASFHTRIANRPSNS